MSDREYASFGMELARAEAKGRTLAGYASVFNYPIETMETWLNGTMTYIRPGAFGKTLQEDREDIQSLFNHGHDPLIGEKPLGKPSVMREDAHGLYVEVPLDETSYNDDIIASLKSGALRSMSIAFEAVDDGYSDDRSMREIHAVRLFEFGPVPFPANRAATAALHSLDGDLYAVQTEIELHWDGTAAMRTCHSSADFRKIAFERANDSDPDTAAHWALPHHPNPGAGPDQQGVSSALAALAGARGTPTSGAPSLKNGVDAARSHLEAHRNAEQSLPTGSSAPDGEPIGASVPDGLMLARAQLVQLEHELRLETERMDRWAQPSS